MKGLIKKGFGYMLGLLIIALAAAAIPELLERGYKPETDRPYQHQLKNDTVKTVNGVYNVIRDSQGRAVYIEEIKKY